MYVCTYFMYRIYVVGVFIYVCIYEFVYVCIVCLYTGTSVYMHPCMYVCMYVCRYVCL